MMLLLKDCMFKASHTQDEDGDEGVKDLIDMTMRKMDHDKDGRVSYSDYVHTVIKEPLMMEAFGTCLPTSRAGNNFVGRILDSRARSNLLQEY